MEEVGIEFFNWDVYADGYTGDSKLIPNYLINGLTKDVKVFSREPYAQDLYEKYTGKNLGVIRKDLNIGDIVPVTNIFNVRENFIDIEIAGGLTVTIDLTREKKLIQVYGYNTPKQFTDALKDRENVKELIGLGLYAYILESVPSIKISLWQGHLNAVRNEFMQQITNQDKAYKAKIVKANKGGFFVEVQGLEAFMPGSLAAPNKIIDFQSYVGKEIIVMIEDYLKDMNSFIVSYKKYLSHILPIKIQELDLYKKYVGYVTGTSKFGVFIEFDNMFTGLLHVSKMDEQTKIEFEKNNFKPGDKIEFYISEIAKDNRIILTKENPEQKLKKLEIFILENKDKILESKVAAVMNFGIIVNVEEFSGLVPSKEFKKNKIMINNFSINDTLNVIFDEFKDNKLFFKLPPVETINNKDKKRNL